MTDSQKCDFRCTEFQCCNNCAKYRGNYVEGEIEKLMSKIEITMLNILFTNNISLQGESGCILRRSNRSSTCNNYVCYKGQRRLR